MRVGDPCMANSETSQVNFVVSVYLVRGGPGEREWFNLYRFISETLLLSEVDPLISYLATNEECEIGLRREDLGIDAREDGDDFDAGINVFIAWYSSVTGILDK